MLIKRAPDIRSSEITPKEVYLDRRKIMAGAGAAAGTLLAGRFAQGIGETSTDGQASGTAKLRFVKSKLSAQGEQPTPIEEATSFCDYYEFGTGKNEPSMYAKRLKTAPWAVSVEGHVNKPRVYDVDGIIKLHPSLEERIYRMRCVETWSMVIPWIGIPLSSVLKAAEPTSKARFVAFETLYDPKQMPGQGKSVLQWPYAEGLRLDEAMHPLCILAVGFYGQPLTNQNGAPIRLVVPWKYGFKSIKAIVRIKCVEKQPKTAWNTAKPTEYGFYANVNPSVDHPRWSQAKERRLGESAMRDTLMFNGYGDQVAGMYAGMDLRINY